MVTIVDSKTQLKSFLQECKESDFAILVPLFCDEDLSPSETGLSLLIVSFEKDETYILCFDHSESILDIPDLSFLEVIDELYVYEKKRFLQVYDLYESIDINLLKWFETSKSLSFQKVPRHFHLFPRSGPKVSVYDLPLTLISDHYEEMIDKLHELVSEYSYLKDLDTFSRYNQDFIEVFSEIESNGLEINTEKFHNVFYEKIERGFGSRVYTDYNLYTSTGRPSNANHNINFGALDPEKNQKEPFISRFSDGLLLNFDYDAFHLRLIGKLIGYDVPSESFHTYLGKKYFGKEELDDEEYEDSKKITFQLLYGDDIEEARNIEFFNQTYDMKEELWELYKKYKIIQTPKFKRKIDGTKISKMNPGKAFSYVLQGYETEYNVSVLGRILELLEDYKTEIILYTYDSFLFDYSMSDGKELVKKIKKIMENDSMLVRGYVGKKFSEMKKISV